MIYRFETFELDDERRELRSGDRELMLQPRVFDLLLFLVRHRDRVVSKQELLDAVWSDVIVADSSVQRAVSLARSALTQAGAGEVIRTHARVGYRFVPEVVELSSASDDADIGSELVRARAAYAHESWEEGAELFRTVDGSQGLEATDLERWAFTAQCAGRAAEAVPALERAVAAHAAAGDPRGASRAAVLLAQIQIDLREVAIARGWLRRAERYLGTDDGCRERAMLEWGEARLALYEGRLEDAIRCGDRARLIGSQIGDPDLESLGLVYSGHAMAAHGQIEEGFDRVDEAAAWVLEGTLSPWAAGLVYCGVIWLCANLGDWRRASQWTDHYTRWCEASGTAAFPGLCRLHRAELLTVQGELESAAGEVATACSLLAVAAPWAEGDAYRVRGDIHLARGDLDGAEAAYRKCHELGWDPQPGAALLEAARGRVDVAIRSLDRSLAETGWAVRQRRALLLAHKVSLAVATGDLAVASDAMGELEANEVLWSSPSHRAEVERAKGELAFGQGRLDDAIAHFRRAVRRWCDLGFDLGLATTRVRLAELLRMSDDHDAARLELEAAEPVLSRLGARPMLERCAVLRAELDAGPARPTSEDVRSGSS